MIKIATLLNVREVRTSANLSALRERCERAVAKAKSATLVDEVIAALKAARTRRNDSMTTRRLAMPTPAAPASPATPPSGGADPAATKTKLLQLLGLPSTATEDDATAAVAAIFDALDPSPQAQQQMAARLGLSTKDLARLRAKKIDPTAYVRVRDEIAAKSPNGAKR